MTKASRSAAGLALLAIALVLAPVRTSLAAGGQTGCGAAELGSIAILPVVGLLAASFTANGHPVTLVIDTGAQISIMTPSAAQRIGAHPPRVAFDRGMSGLAGHLQTHEIELDRFLAGSVELRWHRVLVAPIALGTGPDGLLGVDQLSDYDIDYDFPARRMSFYQKQTCQNATPAWAGAYVSVSANRSLSGHLVFPVELDRHPITAIIDTGSQKTILATSAAEQLGVSRTLLGRDRQVTVRDAAGQEIGSHMHRFAQLAIGQEIFRNPDIIVSDAGIRDADIVLGLDLLGSRRLWFSYGSKRIFLSDR